MNPLNQIAWQRLSTVKTLVFQAQSQSTTPAGWNGTGTGAVEVQALNESTLVFHERGTWHPPEGKTLPFKNVFRWTVIDDWSALRLEHLRFGVERPVYLFHLIPVAERNLQSEIPHVCRDDLYSARMELHETTIRLHWTVTGPRKNESITYLYSSSSK